jgi:serine/threonine protein kinase
MGKQFKKLIKKNSQEHEIIKCIQMFDDLQKDLFLPVYRIQNKNPSFVEIHMKYEPLTVFQLLHQNVDEFRQKYLVQCFQQISSILYVLKKHQILHQDVHLKNILYNSKQKKFYLIDFGIGKILYKINATNWYDYYYYHLNGDQFQLLWNLLLKTNIFMDDFGPLRTTLGSMSKNKKQKLFQILQNSTFYNEKICILCKPQLDIFLFSKHGKIEFKHKREKILFKFLLQRVYIIQYLMVNHQNLLDTILRF